MTQKKAKPADVSGDAANDETALILDYLRKQNRPYSAIDISANLHNKVSKAHTAKVLRELHRKKEIEARVSGKQTVYHAVQDPSDESTAEAAAAMDEEIQQLQEQLTSLKAREKKARAELAALSAKPLLSELRRDVDQLQQEKQVMLDQLEKVQQKDSVYVSPEEKAEIGKEWRRWNRLGAVRKKIFRDLWSKCSEVIPDNMSREELWESLGLDGSPLK